MVQSKEETLNQYINGFLTISVVLLIIAYMRKLLLREERRE
jgi:hypothetical protein